MPGDVEKISYMSYTDQIWAWLVSQATPFSVYFRFAQGWRYAEKGCFIRGVASCLIGGVSTNQQKFMMLRLQELEEGGYDCELVDESLLEQYQCAICMKLLRDARLTECCGQHFCDTCFQQWFKKNKTCPHCRTKKCKSMLNKEKIRDVNQLLVRCTNREKGCARKGELGGLKDHLQSDDGCDYEIVECDYSGYKHCILYFSDGSASGEEEVDFEYLPCSKRVERRDLQAHRKKCPYRDYKCDYCGLTDTFDAIAGSGRITKEQSCDPSPHFSTCGEYPLKCPNKCGGKGIKRKDMKTHRKTCPLERIGCPFKDAGCTAKVARKEMEGHLETNTQMHLMSVFTSHQKLSKRNQALKGEVRKLKKEVQKLKKGGRR